MSYSLQATYWRTGLLLGVVSGGEVVRWADEAIARDHDHAPPPAILETAATLPADLSALRHALWPLVLDPEPATVIEALLGLMHEQLVSGRRSLADTVTILRQMRSMLRLPRVLYDGLNAALVASAGAGGDDHQIVEAWLAQFPAADSSWRRSPPPPLPH